MAVWFGTTPVMVAPSGVAGPGAAPFFTGLADSASFTSVMDARLRAAQGVLDRLIAVRGQRTIDNTLRVYDDLSIALSAVSGPAGILASVHPDAAMRTAAEAVQQRVRALTADLPLNRAVYDALVAIDPRLADLETRYYLQSQLRDFRLAGVDRDEPTRARLSQLQRELVAAVQEFQRNIRDNNRTITVTDRRDLEGLPADYLARHAPGPDGATMIATTDADVRPFLTFATHEEVRKRLYLEFANIGYPANIAVLDRMVALRDAIAKALGQPNWATVDMLDRMSGDVQTVSTFIDRIVEASGPPAAREYAELFARKRQDVPDATGVTAWENTYYAERVKRAQYDFDGQSVRPYFAYDRVTQGLFDVTSTLYGVRFRLAQNIPVWHPSVTAYEMLESDTVIGRFYLDTHPRANKPNNGAFTSIVRSGVAARQLPEVVLVAAFPGEIGRAHV